MAPVDWAPVDWAAVGAGALWTLAAAVAVLAVTFAVALVLGKHAVVDVAWGVGFAAVAVAGYVASADSGDRVRAGLVGGMTVVWGLRLAAHIGRRTRGHEEDPRYRALLAQAPGNPAWFALRRVYLTQAVVLWFVSLPVLVAMFETPGPGWVAWTGVAVWLVGLVLETVGDLQLQRFRNDPGSAGKVLDTGLWRYTRHPNYFGDACVWWGIWLVAAGAWPGVLTVLSPLVMTWLLARGTGKPLLEKDITHRRPGYADYVRRTSGFVPLPPKKQTKETTQA